MSDQDQIFEAMMGQHGVRVKDITSEAIAIALSESLVGGRFWMVFTASKYCRPDCLQVIALRIGADTRAAQFKFLAQARALELAKDRDNFWSTVNHTVLDAEAPAVHAALVKGFLRFGINPENVKTVLGMSRSGRMRFLLSCLEALPDNDSNFTFDDWYDLAKWCNRRYGKGNTIEGIGSRLLYRLCRRKMEAIIAQDAEELVQEKSSG